MKQDCQNCMSPLSSTIAPCYYALVKCFSTTDKRFGGSTTLLAVLLIGSVGCSPPPNVLWLTKYIARAPNIMYAVSAMRMRKRPRFGALNPYCHSLTDTNVVVEQNKCDTSSYYVNTNEKRLHFFGKMYFVRVVIVLRNSYSLPPIYKALLRLCCW